MRLEHIARSAISKRSIAAGFTVVELLVVIGVIGLLMALLLPALFGARRAAERTTCLARLNQLGTAQSAFVALEGRFPAAAISAPDPEDPGNPHNFFRWSALARLMPYLEESAVHDRINFERPLYDFPTVLADHTTIVRGTVAAFLCPSDTIGRTSPDFGGTNYVSNLGTGINGGTPFDTDGPYFINSAVRPRDILDGLGQTAAMSESLLGRDEPRGQETPERSYAFSTSFGDPQLTDAGCEAAFLFNVTDPRGFSWANGEYRTTFYNHHLPPNSERLDCIASAASGPIERRFAAWGLRGARSLHPGGVNLLYADGRAAFVGDSVDLTPWRAIATIDRNEVYRID